MELLVDIPEWQYEAVRSGKFDIGVQTNILCSVIHGIPLPKGHWEHGKELCKEYQGRILVDVTYADWHCSNCNYVIKGTVKPKWNYCPNCRADMQMQS